MPPVLIFAEDMADIETYLTAHAERAVAQRYLADSRKLYTHLTNHPNNCSARLEIGLLVRLVIVAPC
jgi:hypothetical protein